MVVLEPSISVLIVEKCNTNKSGSDNKQLMGFQLIRRQDYCSYLRKQLKNKKFFAVLSEVQGAEQSFFTVSFVLK